MNETTVLNALPQGVFNREAIYAAVGSIHPNRVSESQARYCVSSMLERNQIVRIGRNEYTKATGTPLPEFVGEYSPEAGRVAAFMEEHYPLLEYRIWELSWLNEFVNHLFGKNIIFLEAEKNACEFVFEDLSAESDARVLLKPTEKELMRYSDAGTVVISALISEAPRGNAGNHGAPLEKMIVDLFANKLIPISGSELGNAAQAMLHKYRVNRSTLLRYARRRGKEEEIQCFLQKTLRPGT